MVNEILQGNCLDRLKELDDNSVDSIVTDPPYELGFMGKKWDKSGIAYNVDVWKECLRVLKPGGHMLAFGGSRTFHRIAVAIEDAGFEIRDTIMWLYGSGFPKSHNISKAIDREHGKEVSNDGYVPNYKDKTYGNGLGGGRKTEVENPATPEAQMWQGWGTALKPAHEPIILARKPLAEKTIADNVLKHGTGGINIDDCRVETDDVLGRNNGGKDKLTWGGTYGAGKNENYKRKEKGLHELGRWPANVIHDGSDEVMELFPETKSGGGVKVTGNGEEKRSTYCLNRQKRGKTWTPNFGSAARFFYCAKASRKERDKGCENLQDKLGGSLEGGNDKRNGKNKPQLKPVKNHHPTVKPLELMKYLVRLITPPEGIVLDPFAGSGTTLIAATLQDFNYIGIELNEEYIEIAKKRIEAFEREQQNKEKQEAEMSL